MRRLLITLGMLFVFASTVFAQNQQSFPRMRLSFDGSSTASTLDLGGWTRIRLMTPAPPISAAGEARFYFDGTNLKLSLNGGAYVNWVPAGVPGTVTSVGLAFSPTSIWTVSGSPVTTAGTLTATLATQTANTIFSGPTTGGAAQPGFRALVTNDIPALDAAKITTGTFTAGRVNSTSILDGTILFADWASNSCASGNIPKWNGSAWACAGDDTSPGGSSWLTAGNTLAATGAKLGALDAFAYDIVGNNISLATVSTTPNITFHGRVISDQTTNHAFATTTTDGGSLFGYYKMTQRTLSGIAAPGGTEAVMFMDSADGHVYIKEGAAAAFRVGAAVVGATTYVQWTAQQAIQPTTNFATFDTRNDHPILAFSNTVADSALFAGQIPEEWDGTTLEIQFTWVAQTAITGNVRWECSMERDDTATDIDADSFGTVVLVTTATNTTAAGRVNSTTCSMSTAAIRDNVVAGEPFRILIRRLGADALDTMSADAQLLTIQLRHP